MNDRDDLDALVTELNAGVPTVGGIRGRGPGVNNVAETARLRTWLEHVVERSASDLLLVSGAPPSLRVENAIVPLTEGPLGSEEIADAILPALPPHARRMYREAGIADGSFRAPDLGRFRINLRHERGRAAAAIRRLPTVVPRLASLNLPPTVEALTRLPRGLVLLGGPTGSGKTTTLAALVNEINHREARHIITIEDPIGDHDHAQARLVHARGIAGRADETRPRRSQGRAGARRPSGRARASADVAQAFRPARASASQFLPGAGPRRVAETARIYSSQRRRSSVFSRLRAAVRWHIVRRHDLRR
jgi:hypothetical protein